MDDENRKEEPAASTSKKENGHESGDKEQLKTGVEQVKTNREYDDLSSCETFASGSTCVSCAKLKLLRRSSHERKRERRVMKNKIQRGRVTKRKHHQRRNNRQRHTRKPKKRPTKLPHNDAEPTKVPEANVQTESIPSSLLSRITSRASSDVVSTYYYHRCIARQQRH